MSPEPVIDIGRGNTEEDQLYRVGGAVRLTDGRIAIANTGTGEIRFYSSDGALLRRMELRWAHAGSSDQIEWLGPVPKLLVAQLFVDKKPPDAG